MKDESKQLKTKILVCCHKQDLCAKEEPYFPIQVGKAISNIDLGIQGDDTGDNISAKNTSYCELTGLYWAWKNLKDVDVIGLCHYRRYFDFHHSVKWPFPHKSFPSSTFSEDMVSVPEEILQKVYNGSVILAAPRNYRYNLMVEYCVSHIGDDFRILRQVIKDTQPKDIQDAFFKVMYRGHKLCPYNMFLMNRNDFDEYCSWVFHILNAVEKAVDISTYNSFQRRIFGYMSERLLNVWVEAKKKQIEFKPVIWVNDGKDIMSVYSSLSLFVRNTLNDFSNFFQFYINPDF